MLPSPLRTCYFWVYLSSFFLSASIYLLHPPQGLQADPAPAKSSLKERVTLSVEAYRALLNSTQGQREQATWSDTHLTVDLSQARQSGWAWVEVAAILTGHQESWASLTPLTASPLQVWLDEQVVSPQNGAGYYEVQLKGRQALKLRYPTRLERREDGSQVALIPTPMTTSATFEIIGAPTGTELTPPHTSSTKVRLNGAIAVTLPPEGSGHLIQRQDLKVSLHSSQDGVELQSNIEVLLRGRTSWVPIAPIHEALLSAKLDGKEAIISAQGSWLSAWVEGEGTHQLQSHVRVPIDRSNGQPKVNLTLLNAPRGHLSVSLPGQREILFTPQLPSLTQTIPVVEGTQELSTLSELDLPPLKALSFGWAEKKETPEDSIAQFLVDSYQLFSVQEGLLKAEARLEIEVMKGELERFSVKIPDGVVLYRVEGEGVESWVTLPAQEISTVHEVALPRRVLIEFGTPFQGKRSLDLKWQRVINLGERFELPIITPQEAFQQAGVIALYDGERVGFTPAERQGALIPAGQEALPQHILQIRAGEKVTQAFRHFQAPGTLFTSSTSERTQEVRFDAQIDTLYTAREGSIRAQTQALITLKSGRLDQLVIQLPKACSEPQVSGPSLNRVEALPDHEQSIEGITRYLVRFTRRLEGALTLNIDTELLVATEKNESMLPRLVVEGAELSRGALGISAELGLEISPHDQEEASAALHKASIDELPRSIRLRSHVELLYGYRFTRPWSLTVGLKRHEVVETLTARVLSTTWNSQILRSGQIVHEMNYEIENQERRTARFTLPKNSRIRAIKVNGQLARAQDEEGVISVPIQMYHTSQIYISYERALEGSHTELILTAPQSDLHSSQIKWQIHYDEGLRLSSSDGLFHLSSSRYAKMGPSGTKLHSSHFSYDLLEPNAAPLKLRLSFITRLPERFIESIHVLCQILLILWTFLWISRRKNNLWMTMVVTAFIILQISLQMYQEGLGQSFKIFTNLGGDLLVSLAVSALIGGTVYFIKFIKNLPKKQVQQSHETQVISATESKVHHTQDNSSDSEVHEDEV